MGLSNIGIFHTVIGIVAVFAAIFSLFRYARINLDVLSGKIYFYCTIVASLSALALRKHGFNPGHILSLLVFVLVVSAWYLNSKRPQSKRARYFENLWLSFSFFLSLIPTANETLTRVPIHQPIAKGPTDPIVINTLLALLIAFVIGSVLQFIRQRGINRAN